MATLFEYYTKDFSSCMVCSFIWDQAHLDNLKITVGVALDINSNSKFIAYYLPKHADYMGICEQLVENCCEGALKKSEDVEITSCFPADITIGIPGAQNYVFSKRVYIYTQNNFSADEIAKLDGIAKTKGLFLTLRTEKYSEERNGLEKPLAFISHDSRDKKDIAIHIATGLQKMMCPVWYDEFSLKVGDNLRTSIENGLKETKKCVLILSPNFLSNTGWTKKEFDSVFTRELLEKKSVILPVWHNVTKAQVYDYSPSLALTVAANWSSGEKEVLGQLYRAITFKDKE